MSEDNPSLPRLSLLLVNQRWLREELMALGHTVVTAGWSDDQFDIVLPGSGIQLNTVLSSLPVGFTLDGIVYFDSSSPLGIFGIEDSPVPTIFYSVDSHHHANWHSRFGAVVDYVLVAQKDLLPTFRSLQSNAAWFPLWAPMQAVPAVEKKYGAVFRGTLDPKLHPARAQFFEALKRHVPVDVAQGGYVDIYRQAKIVINQAVKDDVNFRIFEALMCGALLITPRVGNGLLDLFVDGEELVTYEPGNVEDAAAKIRFYLCHEQAREAIARRGWEKVNKLHTRERRAEELTSIFYKLNCAERRKDYTSAALTYLSSSTMCRKNATIAGHLLLFEAQRAFELACANREPLTSELINGIAIAKFLLELENYSDRVHALTTAAWEAYPEDSTLLILHLDTLLRESREKAATLIKDLSVDSNDFLDSIPACVNEWRSSLHARIAAAL